MQWTETDKSKSQARWWQSRFNDDLAEAMKKTEKTRGVADRGKSKHMPWKKGDPSPNPRGRPRTGVFSAAIRSMLAEVDEQTQRTKAEQLTQLAFRRACQGSYRHLELLLAYAEGRPKQGLELSGPNGGAVNFGMTLEEIDQKLAEKIGAERFEEWKKQHVRQP